MAPSVEELRKRFESLPSEDLIAAIHPHAGYTETAIGVARAVLEERGVDLKSPAARKLHDQLQREFKEAADQADEPLGVPTRIICLIFCGIPALLIAAVAFTKGHTRRGTEALQWMIIGIVTWTVFGFLSRL
jgi:hypothetical protein